MYAIPRNFAQLVAYSGSKSKHSTPHPLTKQNDSHEIHLQKSWGAKQKTYIGNEVEKAGDRGARDSFSRDQKHQQVSLQVVSGVGITLACQQAEHEDNHLDRLDAGYEQEAVLKRFSFKHLSSLVILIHANQHNEVELKYKCYKVKAGQLRARYKCGTSY